MKSFLKYFLFLIGRAFSFIYPYKLNDIFIKLKTRLYSGWVSSQFNRFGDNSLVKFPIKLIGNRFISIGKSTIVQKNGVITAWEYYKGNRYNPQITIGNNVNIGEYCHITAINKIIIGNGVLTGRWLTITDNSHGKTDGESLSLPPSKRPLHSSGEVIIEDNVWIGDKVTILPNVRIGKNVIIGANSVVTKNIPDKHIVAGNPAKTIKIIQ